MAVVKTTLENEDKIDREAALNKGQLLG